MKAFILGSILAAYSVSGFAQAPTIAGCPVFPANNAWNTRIDQLPLDSRSATYISNITPSGTLRFDITIPINIVPGTQPKVPLTIDPGEAESDPGPYPIPPNPKIEDGSDGHILVVDKDNCMLYEVFLAEPQTGGGWHVYSAAKWSLLSNALRPFGWTSADAAGLPMTPGLIRYDEVAAGQINHALRFTAPRTRREFIWPARHLASNTSDPIYPPMGQRFRLKANFDVSSFTPRVQTILRAMKTYGIMLADNGLPWQMQFELDSRWDFDEMLALRTIPGSNLEAVDASSLMVNPDSGEAVQPGVTPVTVANIVSPAPGSTLAGDTVTFTWTAISGADNYWLDVGNSIAQGDLSAGATNATSRTVTGLPCNGRTLHVQLWTHLNGAWQTPQRYAYTAASSCGSAVAQITSPTPGSTLDSDTATFTWTAISGADNYWLDVGNTVTLGDLSAGPTTATSRLVTGLPCNGRTLHVQLWTHLNGAWQTPQRYTYTASSSCGTVARITSPPPGSALTGTSATFTWTAIPGADNYWLDVGNSVAQGDLSANPTAATSATVNGLPCNGRTLHVQLWTHLNGTWQQPQRYAYSACNVAGLAQITAPAPGSMLQGTSATFTWTPSAGASAYWLDVGTVPGQGNIFGANLGNATSYTVTGLPSGGGPVYVQLWTLRGSQWYLYQYVYTAAP
jgi:hypothetical protein